MSMTVIEKQSREAARLRNEASFRKLTDLLDSKTYGDLITNDELVAILGFVPEQGVRRRIRSYMSERGYSLASVTGDGFRVKTAKERGITDVEKHMDKTVRIGIRVLSAAKSVNPVKEGFTQSEIRRHDHVTTQLHGQMANAAYDKEERKRRYSLTTKENREERLLVAGLINKKKEEN